MPALRALTRVSGIPRSAPLMIAKTDIAGTMTARNPGLTWPSSAPNST
ncbi:hypothetical protein RCH16_001969 [Cryobacterium sp. MP_M5]|nr:MULTISPECIES: hypothetical protein [unclassified Cryobacterium]MBG6058389.1 hypothetical protein [Cryobacterium sp. MP_M3]MEC5176959.1 hypothetical protein [Cryobacterium sp. MP_M5]